MEAVKISLSDYVLAGGGANGESYDHKTDPSVMLKLYHAGKIEQPLSEMMLARKVYEAGIPTPEPGEYVVTEDGRYGIRFRRIIGKKSYARAIGDDPANVEKYAAEFAEMCIKLHQTHVDTTQFENVKDHYFKLLEQNPFFTPTEKDKLGRFIADMPDSDIAHHGDLQFGNALFVGDQRYFIDLGDFCYGGTMLDVSMVYLCSVLSNEEFIQEAFHMPKSVSEVFWGYFAHDYFGADRPLRDINEEVDPYAGLKTLLVERDTKCPMPEFREKLVSILK